jgi:hypothetical protein
MQESILEASDASSRYSSVILTRTGLRTVSRERFVWSGWEALGQVELCPRYLIVTFNVKDAILGHCRLKASSTSGLRRTTCGRRRRSEVELAQPLRRRSQAAP